MPLHRRVARCRSFWPHGPPAAAAVTKPNSAHRHNLCLPSAVRLWALMPAAQACSVPHLMGEPCPPATKTEAVKARKNVRKTRNARPETATRPKAAAGAAFSVRVNSASDALRASSRARRKPIRASSSAMEPSARFAGRVTTATAADVFGPSVQHRPTGYVQMNGSTTISAIVLATPAASVTRAAALIHAHRSDGRAVVQGTTTKPATADAVSTTLRAIGSHAPAFPTNPSSSTGRCVRASRWQHR